MQIFYALGLKRLRGLSVFIILVIFFITLHLSMYNRYLFYSWYRHKGAIGWRVHCKKFYLECRKFFEKYFP